jgi:hypothetical protein
MMFDESKELMKLIRLAGRHHEAGHGGVAFVVYLDV